MSTEDCLAIVENLPRNVDRLILSGGEPLTERVKLHIILEAIRDRYRDRTQVMLQTNGDLLTGDRLDALLERGVSRIDVASMDRFHKHSGARRGELEALFRSRGMLGDETDPLVTREAYLKRGVASYGFWGANEDFWIGGNWARGRSMQTGVWKKDGDHNFCAILSGARGFLGDTELPQEVSIQLWRINPCCPGTKDPLGDARVEAVSEVLQRVSEHPVFRALNQGDAFGMGRSMGIDENHGKGRSRALGNVCLWCDEFFDQHFHMGELRQRGPGEARGLVQLPTLRS